MRILPLLSLAPAAAVLWSLGGPPGALASEPVVLSLPEALFTAMQNNLGLVNASLEVAKSEKDKSIVDRERLPEVSLDGRYTRLELPETSDIPVPGFSYPDSEADLSLVATMPLWTGGRLSSAGRLAEKGVELTRQSERITRGDLLLETATAYYDLLAGQKLVETTEEALENSLQHLRDVEALLKQGQVAQSDLYRTELDVAERERDHAQSEANLIRRAEHLSSLLYPEEYFTVRARWQAPDPFAVPSAEEWFALAESGSPEITVSLLSLELAGEEIAAAKAERFPALGLFGAYGARDERFSYSEEDRYWNTGLALSFPLFKGGRTLLEIDKSRDTEKQASNSLVQTRRLVRRGIVDAHAGVELALRQHAAALKAIRSAEENLRVTQLKYREGLVSNTDVIDALLSLSRARFDRIQALNHYHANRTRLMRLAGTIEEII